MQLLFDLHVLLERFVSVLGTKCELAFFNSFRYFTGGPGKLCLDDLDYSSNDEFQKYVEICHFSSLVLYLALVSLFICDLAVVSYFCSGAKQEIDE